MTGWALDSKTTAPKETMQQYLKNIGKYMYTAKLEKAHKAPGTRSTENRQIVNMHSVPIYPKHCQ